MGPEGTSQCRKTGPEGRQKITAVQIGWKTNRYSGFLALRRGLFFQNDIQATIESMGMIKERVEGNPKLSLLGKSGELTKLGRAYVDMPVHDPLVYYRIPGKLQAESYTAAADPSIRLTSEACWLRRRSSSFSTFSRSRFAASRRPPSAAKPAPFDPGSSEHHHEEVPAKMTARKMDQVPRPQSPDCDSTSGRPERRAGPA